MTVDRPTETGHNALVELAGARALRDAFGLSPQALYNWRRRGIPDAQRVAVAQMLLRAGHELDVLPAGFVDDATLQLLRLSSAVRDVSREGEAA